MEGQNWRLDFREAFHQILINWFRDISLYYLFTVIEKINKFQLVPSVNIFLELSPHHGKTVNQMEIKLTRHWWLLWVYVILRPKLYINKKHRKLFFSTLLNMQSKSMTFVVTIPVLSVTLNIVYFPEMSLLWKKCIFWCLFNGQQPWNNSSFLNQH